MGDYVVVRPFTHMERRLDSVPMPKEIQAHVNRCPIEQGQEPKALKDCIREGLDYSMSRSEKTNKPVVIMFDQTIDGLSKRFRHSDVPPSNPYNQPFSKPYSQPYSLEVVDIDQVKIVDSNGKPMSINELKPRPRIPGTLGRRAENDPNLQHKPETNPMGGRFLELDLDRDGDADVRLNDKKS